MNANADGGGGGSHPFIDAPTDKQLLTELVQQARRLNAGDAPSTKHSFQTSPGCNSTTNSGAGKGCATSEYTLASLPYDMIGPAQQRVIV